MTIREITTTAELARLSEDAVIKDAAGDVCELQVWRNERIWLWTRGSTEFLDDEIDLPARVLWEPEQD